VAAAQDVLAEDILAQPEAYRSLAGDGPGPGPGPGPGDWDRSLAVLGDLGRFRRLVLTGMGSSYFASVAAAGALCARGVPAVAELASTLLHYGRGRLGPGDLVVVTSQSGESAEAVKLASALRLGRQPHPGPGDPFPVVAVTCHVSSPLARAAAAVLAVEVAPDHGVAVKTFGATLLALLYLGARVGAARGEARGAGPEAAERLDAAAWAERARRAADAVALANAQGESWRALGRRLRGHPAAVVTSRGPSLGAAMAGALLFNEVAKVPAWAEEGGEFRHGVIEVAEPGFLAAVIVPPGPGAALEGALAADLASLGTRVLVVSQVSFRSETEAAQAAGADILWVPDLDEPLAPLVQIVPFQWLSLGWAEAAGLEPGRFRNMSGVVRSEAGAGAKAG